MVAGCRMLPLICVKSFITIRLETTEPYAQYTPPTPTRRNCRVASRRRRRCEHEFATTSTRLPTDTVDDLETEHSSLTTWILIDIDKFFNNDVIMSSLVCHQPQQPNCDWLNSTRNCKLGHDCRLRCRQICSDSSKLSPTSCVHTADATQLDSCVASASAVCIGH